MLSKLLLFLDQTGLLHSGCDTRHKASVFAGFGRRCSDLCLTTRSAGGGGPSIPFVTSPGPKGCEVRLCGWRRRGPGKGRLAGVEFSSNVRGVNHAKWIGAEGSHSDSGREYFPRAKTH